MCGAALRAYDVKIVISSQAAGGTGLPLEKRLLCGRCFLNGKPGSKAEHGADGREVLAGVLAR